MSLLQYVGASQVELVVKNLLASAGDTGRHGFHLQVRKIPGEGNGNPVSLPGSSHGQRSLVGYSPWGCRESDATESFNVMYNYIKS